MKLLYLIITLFATTVGSATGMGGGVIIKPVLDALGHYNIETINVLSSISVFAMSLVSVFKNIKNKSEKTDIKIQEIFSLAIASIIGGYVGNKLFVYIAKTQNSNLVKIIQNSILIFLIIVIYIYMKNKDKIKTLNLKGMVSSFCVGLFLGTISSFLGIGGGPINVAILIFVFGYNTKIATSVSLVTILFSQLSKLLSITLTTGFGIFDLSILPFMLVGAITGGMLGSNINKKLPEKKVDILFNRIQILIMLICVYNIINSL